MKVVVQQFYNYCNRIGGFAHYKHLLLLAGFGFGTRHRGVRGYDSRKSIHR